MVEIVSRSAWIRDDVQAVLIVAALSGAWGGCGDDGDPHPTMSHQPGIPAQSAADAGMPALSNASGSSMGGPIDAGHDAGPAMTLPTRTDAAADAQPGPTMDPAAFNGEIDGVGMGDSVGGFPVPVWLYRGGLAISNDAPLPIKQVAAMHYRENPDLWFQWRRTAGGIEIKQEREWHLLEYPYVFGPLPAGTSVRGTFISENNPSLKLVKYRFAASGQFDYCEYVGLVMRGSRWSGSYDVDGFVIELDADDDLETYSFVYDPVMRPNTLWIDGTPFKRDNSESASSGFSCP